MCLCVLCARALSVQLRQCGGTNRRKRPPPARGSSTQTFIHFQCDIVMRAFLFKISVWVYACTCHLLNRLIDGFILSHPRIGYASAHSNVYMFFQTMTKRKTSTETTDRPPTARRSSPMRSTTSKPLSLSLSLAHSPEPVRIIPRSAELYVIHAHVYPGSVVHINHTAHTHTKHLML